MSGTTGTCTCTHTTEIHPVAECIEQAAAMFARLEREATRPTREDAPDE